MIYCTSASKASYCVGLRRKATWWWMTGCSKTKYRQLLALSRPALVNSTCISQSLVRLRSYIYAICEYFILIQIQIKDNTVRMFIRLDLSNLARKRAIQHHPWVIWGWNLFLYLRRLSSLDGLTVKIEVHQLAPYYKIAPAKIAQNYKSKHQTNLLDRTKDEGMEMSLTIIHFQFEQAAAVSSFSRQY